MTTASESTKHTAFTPGPWTTAEREDGHIDILHRYEMPERGPGHEVAGVAVISYAMEATEANARLVAAAPLLLEALEAMVEHYPGLDKQPLIQSALAAARGEGSAQ